MTADQLLDDDGAQVEPVRPKVLEEGHNTGSKEDLGFSDLKPSLMGRKEGEK